MTRLAAFRPAALPCFFWAAAFLAAPPGALRAFT